MPHDKITGARICSAKGCNENNPEKFGKDKSQPDGLRFYCKACRKVLRKKEKRSSGPAVNAYNVRYKYKLSAEQCGSECFGSQRHIDHNHSCCPGERSCGNCVRGVLCADCNLGLGRFKDDPKRLMSAISYLQLPKAA